MLNLISCPGNLGTHPIFLKNLYALICQSDKLQSDNFKLLFA